MSVHKIKTGNSKPTPQDLVERQIGYDTKEKNLYINVGGSLDNIGGEGTYKPLQESVIALEEKAMIVKPRPNTDPAQFRGKRVLMQSITAEKANQGLLTGWSIDLDTGDEISFDFDASQLINGIASINQANVKPRPDTDPVQFRGKRVLLQSITTENIDKGIVTGWSIDLDTGAEIKYDFSIVEIFAPITSKIDKADTTLFGKGGWEDQLFADGKEGWEHPAGGLGALPALFGEGTLYDESKPRKNFPTALLELDAIGNLVNEIGNDVDIIWGEGAPEDDDEIIIEWN